jgi:hypothetical protein
MRKIPDDKLAGLPTSETANYKLIEDLFDPKNGM